MKRQVMNYVEREKVILDYINTHSFASTEVICALTGVSLVTTRRDFSIMSNKGLIARSHGGIQALVPAQLTAMPPHASSNFVSSIDEEKAQIARHAASLVLENDCIFIGAGKTCNLLADYLSKSVEYLTVVTTSLNAVLKLIECPNISVHLLGGDIHSGTNFIETVTTDNHIECNIGSMFFDKVFITVDGIDLDRGYTIRYPHQIPLYTRLLAASREFWVLVNSSKFDLRSFVPVYGMNQIKNIVTTKKIPKAYLNFYHQNGTNLIVI